MPNLVIAITGPAGSGKTTVGEKVAKKLESCVNIDADHIKHMLVSGFYKDAKNPGGWGFNQWGLVGESIAILAANFLKEGYSVVINGYMDEPAWKNIEKRVAIVHKFLLLPSVEKVISRDAARRSEIVMGEAAVKQHHQTFSNDNFYASFKKLDSTSQTVDETVNAIINIVQ